VKKVIQIVDSFHSTFCSLSNFLQAQAIDRFVFSVPTISRHQNAKKKCHRARPLEPPTHLSLPHVRVAPHLSTHSRSEARVCENQKKDLTNEVRKTKNVLSVLMLHLSIALQNKRVEGKLLDLFYPPSRS
jgi:hypothetical protein